VLITVFSLRAAVAADPEISSSSASLIVSKDNVEIPQKGASEFIDVYIKLQDGSTLDITHKANWETDNQDVAIAYDGKILALGEGNTFVTVSYNGMKQIIQVKVLKQKVFESKISIATSERDLTKSKCSAYEQTPYMATWTIWTYDQLADGKYRPFGRGY